jgi:outer membrane receptor protein involved in Fe transport
MCSAVSGQVRTGIIAGSIRSGEGRVLPGVTVTVENDLTPGRRTAVTDDAGRYAIEDMPAEDGYSVRVALAGFDTIATEQLTVSPGERTTVDFVLKLTVRETVAVASESPIAESHQSAVQQTVTDQLAHTLPLQERNFIPLASLAAGFTGNPNYPSPQGQTYWSNNVIVDGASHFSKWRSAPRSFYSGYGLESIKDVQVLTNRFSAEYGEALATVTSAVTRAGDDRFRGSALLFVQDSAMNEPPVFSPINPPSDSQRAGVTLGGPIVRGETHFLASYEGRRARGSNVVVSPAAYGSIVPDNEDEHLGFFRFDHRIGPTHFLASRYNGQFFRWHDEPGGLSLPGTGTYFVNDMHTWLTTDRRETAGGWLSELRFQFARYRDMRTDLQPTVFVSRSGYSEEGGTIGSLGFGADPEDTWEGADVLSRLLDKHAIKTGAGVKYVRSQDPALTYARGAYFYAGAPDQYPAPYLFMQGLAPTPDNVVANPRSVSLFGFVQDDWRMTPTVTVNAGLRYDIEQIWNVRNYAAPADANNVQPRVGVAWRPLDDDRLVVRGGVGVYTQQHLLYYINKVQQEGLDGAVALTLAPSSPLFPTYPQVLAPFPPGVPYPPRNVQIADARFSNPYSIQSTAGVERVIARTRLSADYVYLRGTNLMSLLDLNAPASNVKPNQRTVAQADATRQDVFPGSFRQVIQLGNVGESWYHALQIKADRSVGRLQAIASYTFAHAEDMDNYQLPEDSRNLAAEKARANTDVRHNLSVGFNWSLPGTSVALRNWAVSGVAMLRSNRPYTITWGDDRNGTTQNDARPDGRNTAETDSYQTADLSVSRRFTIGTTTIEGRLEGFNIFNVTNYDEYVGALLSPYYGQPISAFPTRRFQLAAIARF